MIFQKFTLLSKKLATLEDSGTGFGRFNLVFILRIWFSLILEIWESRSFWVPYVVSSLYSGFFGYLHLENLHFFYA